MTHRVSFLGSRLGGVDMGSLRGGILSLLVVNMIAIAQKSHLSKLQRRFAEAICVKTGGGSRLEGVGFVLFSLL